MFAPDEIRLWCWVLGDPHDRVFAVSIKRSAPIDDLKIVIQGRKPSFKDIPADSIGLYKFQLPLEDFNEDYAQSINLEDGQKLKSFNDVSVYWMNEPGKVLSVIIPRPAGVTIIPSSSQNSNLNLPPSWLVETHSELWGRRDLFGEIFRTATLTEDHFIELQRLLEALNPERKSEDYVAKDVLATKSAFLYDRSTALDADADVSDSPVPGLVFEASQPPTSAVVGNDNDNDDAVDVDGDDAVAVDDDDAVADDDDDAVADDADDAEVDDDDDAVAGDAMPVDIDPVNTHMHHLLQEATPIFPHTVRYVNLTFLKPDLRVPRLMLYREEWVSLIDAFNKRRKGMRGSAVFSGQPGIGKTCLLYSILILCIIRSKPIMFQDVAGKVFIIDDSGVRTPTVQGNGHVADILTLVDAGGRETSEPSQYLLNDYKYRILLTSSPRTSKDRWWLKQIVGDEDAVFVTAPWSRKEFVVASLFLHNTDITLKRLQETSHICGNIPRRCFRAAVSPGDLSDAKNKIKDAIQDTNKLHDVVFNVRRGNPIHRAFQIRPSPESRFLVSCLVEPVSAWAFLEMLDELRERNADAAYQFFLNVRGSPDSATLCGKAFETYFHRFVKTPRIFTIKSLDKRSVTLDIHFPANTNHLIFDDLKHCFSDRLASSVASKTSLYLRPQSPVFPSFDSFLYQPTISQVGFSPLIALQVTTAADHPINIKGLKEVQMSLKPKVSQLKYLRPTTKRRMIILFVVPNTLEANFMKQRISAKKGETDWYKKTAQYILTIPEKEMFFQVM
ncbi:hypothetical protein APHAL10511_008166 [Amanita phalloides]|nr:hypothetical protein APHAL10511_008166 [Amanita phalloides]